MSGEVLAWVADALVLAAVLVVTLSVVGVARMPDVYMKLHAAGKAAALAILFAALAAAAAGGDAALTTRALLAAGFVLLTAPVSAHAVGAAAALRGDRMEGVDVVDESGRGLHRDAGARGRGQR